MVEKIFAVFCITLCKQQWRIMFDFPQAVSVEGAVFLSHLSFLVRSIESSTLPLQARMGAGLASFSL